MFEIKFINRGFKDNLVLIPGWATDWRIFDGLDLNYNYISLTEFSPSNFVGGLSQYLENNSIDKVSMFGWSMGAFLAADFTVRNQNKIKELCWGGSAVFSALYMAHRGMWTSMDEKCRRIDAETEGAD